VLERGFAVGSHSLVRKKVERNRTYADNRRPIVALSANRTFAEKQRSRTDSRAMRQSA
jgi:hypothetical protein